MFPSTRIAAGLLAGAILVPSATSAQGHETHCALIVASRPSLAEAHQFRYENPQLPIEAIFQSSNGWLAISTGILEKWRAPSVLAELKAKAYIPQDSYCSDGEAYLEALWMAPETAPSAGQEPGYTMAAYAPFDARPLSRDEKRVLQAGLAYFGHYSGLLDGVWGNGTQAAFEDFARKRLSAADQNWVASELLKATIDLWDAQDWRYYGLDHFDASIQMPVTLMDAEDDGQTAEFHTPDEATYGFIQRTSAPIVRDLHERILGLHDGTEEPYVVRKDDLWVTAVRYGGLRTYARSFWSARLRQWTTMAIDFRHSQPEIAHFMIASFQQGPAAPLRLGDSAFLNIMASQHDNEGRLGRLVYAALPPGMAPPSMVQPAAPAPRPTPEPAPVPPEVTAGSGSGFFINADGVALTNEHVAGNCPGMTMNGRPARLLAASEEFDLALVEYAEPRQVGHYLAFSPSAGRLNSDVTVAGFPLRAVLGGLNITRGAISSMQGMGGSWTEMQISAPVQSGNSGGPIVDRYGNVVGVVVSKLDALVSVELFDDLPQNVNFGVRGEMGKTFAELHDVDFSVGEEGDPLSPEDLAVMLEKTTVLIECR